MVSALTLVTLLLNLVMEARSSTRFYQFKVEFTNVTKLCNTRSIVTINGMYPGPVIYAQEDDRVIINVTNETPYNITIHWHGVRQMLSCWYDGPSYITQCPIQNGQSFTYNFTLANQKGTLLWHAHSSWLRGTVYGAFLVYPKTGIPYPFNSPFQEHILILGEYWQKDLVHVEHDVLSGGGIPPLADALTINGHPGPNYDCSANDVYEMDVIRGKTYLLRVINAALNTESFFSIANHELEIVEADGEYTKPVTLDQIMLGPGQTMNVLVTANRPAAKYAMSMSPYMSARGNVSFQKTNSVGYFCYRGSLSSAIVAPIRLPSFNDNRAVKTVMDGLKSLGRNDVPKEIDTNLFITVGLNVEKCKSNTPWKDCKGLENGVMAASMNNISFVTPNISILEAYHKKINGYYTEDFPSMPPRFYDFVNGAPNKITYDTQSMVGTRTKVIEYGSQVQMILQDTSTVTTENHPIHLHGYSFYVVGYGSGNYNPKVAALNLVDPPYLNTIGVPVGGWAAIRFTADNPGVWFMHCHLEVHASWGLSVVLIVKDGKRQREKLPPPPPDIPRC